MNALTAATAVVFAVLLTWSAWRTRRDFAAAPGTFRCKVRLRSAADLPGMSSSWARWPYRALWVHDVLVVRRGLLRPKIWYLAARMADGDLVELEPRRVRGLGRRPVSVRVFLDDGQEIELAAAERDRSLLCGPFFAVAVRVLPHDQRRGGGLPG